MKKQNNTTNAADAKLSVTPAIVTATVAANDFTLMPLTDLLEEDVRGLVVDLRTRKADGSLRYFLQEGKPVYACLTRVYVKRPDRVPWLYWEWDAQTIVSHDPGMSHSCGYSGIMMEQEEAAPSFLHVYGKPEERGCDGEGPHAPGEVRALPMGGDGKAILCEHCYRQQIDFRIEQNRDVPGITPYDLPSWESLPVKGVLS